MRPFRSAAALAAVASAALTILGGAVQSLQLHANSKLTVSSIDGSPRTSIPLKLSDAGRSIDQLQSIALEADDVLRLAFAFAQPKDGADGKEGDTPASTAAAAAIPHQVMVQIQGLDDVAAIDDDGQGNDGSVWTDLVMTKAKGARAAWSLRADRLPIPLRVHRRLLLTLLLGSFTPSDTVRLPLAILEPSTASLVLTPEEAVSALDATPSEPLAERRRAAAQGGFKPWPERRHTFGRPPAESMPPRWYSAAWAIAVLAGPWLVGAGLALPILSRLRLASPSPAQMLLLLALASLEAVAAVAWVRGWSVFESLPWVAALGVAALGSGRAALSEMSRQAKRAGKKAE